MVEEKTGPSHNLLEALDNGYLNSFLNYVSPLPRLIWAVLGMVMLAIALYITVLLVSDYRSYPSYTKVATQSANEFYLPAITICNMNILNKTAMEEKQVEGTQYSVYELYQHLMDSYQERGADIEDNVPFEKLDDMDLYRNYKWNIRSTLDMSSIEFAKEKITGDEREALIQSEFTEMGNCLEINDNQVLVQKVNGPVGGLSLTLDTKVADYTEDTTSQGFFIMFRMPGEKVINKEYAFRVSPGNQVFIQLKPIQVTRLGSPWGTCEGMSDIFTLYNKTSDDDMDVMTLKECFASQVTYLYMKDETCRCFPWYVYARYIKEDGEINTELYDALLDYWTNQLSEEQQITFDKTEVLTDQYAYTGEVLDTSTTDSVRECITECSENEECVYFMWTRASFVSGLTSGGQCDLFDSTATLTELDYKVTRGTVEGTGELEECSISKENFCSNLIIDTLMSPDIMESEFPPECHEPCSYNTTDYRLSMSKFPAQGYWTSTMSKQYTEYKSLDAAQRNLIKLVFFQDVLTMTTETQTASYEIQNFIAELGGTVDLFIGISFYTLYKLIEWIFCSIYRKTKKRKSSGPKQETNTGENEMIKVGV